MVSAPWTYKAVVTVMGNSAEEACALQSAAREAAVFDEVGEGGFAAQEFELVEQIGQLSWVSSRVMLPCQVMLDDPSCLQPLMLAMMQVTEMQSGDPVSIGRQPTAQQTAIIAFAARYHSNMPFQDAQPSMLKEFLPGARSLGCNELQLLNHLHALPHNKWKAAYAPLAKEPPIVPLLGQCTLSCFCALQQE